MPAPNRQGWWWMLAAGSTAGVVIAFAAMRFYGTLGTQPEWRLRLDRDVPQITLKRSSAMSGEALEAQRRIVNEVLRRDEWSEAEAIELCSIMRRGSGEPARAERGEEMVRASASLALLARLEVGAPVTIEAKRRIIAAFAEELAEPRAERRCNAAMALIVTRAIEDPWIRREVERLVEDTDADTAQIVAMQLAHYDDQRSRALALGVAAE